MSGVSIEPRLLAEIGDAIRDQLRALAADPTAARAEQVAANLNGAWRTVLRVREGLLRGKHDAGAR